MEVTITEAHEDIPLSTQLCLAKEGCRFEEMPHRIRSTTQTRDREGSENPSNKKEDTGEGEGKREKDSLSNRTIEYGEGGDEQMLMQMGESGRTFFVYRKNAEEPLVEHLRGSEQRDPERILREIFERRLSRGLTPQPRDLETMQTTGLLMVQEGEVDFASVLVMLDVEVYGSGIMREPGHPRASHEWREITEVRSICTRGTFIQQVGLESFCLNRNDVCLIQHRGHLWNTQDNLARELRDGDYLVIRIKDQDEEIPFHQRWRQQQVCHEEQDQGRHSSGESEHSSDEELEDTQSSGSMSVQPNLQEGGQEQETKNDPNAEEVQGESDMTGLLQVHKNPRREKHQWRPSATGHAQSRLQPPGNGRQRVSFDRQVHFVDQAENREDMAVDNPFIQNFCETRQTDEENDFMKNILHNLRFQCQAKESPNQETPENRDTEEGGDVKDQRSILPLILDEMIGDDYLPLHTSTTIENGLDLTQVETQHEILLQHMTIPCFEIDKVIWNREAAPWINLPQWDFRQAQSIHIYTDGSKKSERCGAGAVLYACDGDQWYFGGFCNHRLDDGKNNFEAEMFGSLMGLKWLWDLLKCFSYSFLPLPEIWLHYDCTASGLITEGRWQGDRNDPVFRAIRSLHQLIELTFQVQIGSQYDRGHRGNPGNEAADSVAKASLTQPRKRNLWDFLCREDVSELLPWIWTMGNEELRPFIRQGILHIPKPEAVYEPKVAYSLEGVRQDTECDTAGRLDLKFVTYNVMTLKTGKRFKGGPGHLRSLFRQCKDDGVHFIALQETRITREHLLKDPDYAYVHSQANRHGNGGMLLAWSKSVQIGQDEEGKEIFMTDEDVSVIFKDEQRMIVKVENDFFKFVIVNVHGPHTGYEDEEVEGFWTDLHHRLEGKWEKYNMVFMGDTNARMGTTETVSVGSFGAEQGTRASECFTEFLERFALWLPATFESTHRGDHYTWYHPNGSGSRIDYVAVPQIWKTCGITSEVKVELGIHGSLTDHQPVQLLVEGLIARRTKKDPWHLKRRQRIQINTHDCQRVQGLQQAFQQVPDYGWDLDVHRHVEYLHRSLTRKARALADKAVHRWKEHLQEDTWEAIQSKAQVRKNYFHWRQCRKLASLRLCWRIWRGEQVATNTEKEIQLANVNYAKSEQQFRQASIKAQDLVRRDDNSFLKSFTSRVELAANQGEMKSLWRELKRFLPKYRNKKQGNVKQNEDLREQWAPHLCQMEAGETTTAEDIYRRCLQRQNKNPGVRSTLKEVPSLLDIEWTLQKAKTGKQGGMDGMEPSWIRCTAREIAPLLWRISLKQNLWGVEAVQFKGGILAMLKKPGGNHTEASGYRGILLSAEMGKRLQALTRKELIDCLYPLRPPLQLGGFQNMEPAFGAQYVRSYVHSCTTMKSSCAVIFVDLKAAYHSLIRQLLTGRCQGDEKDMEIVYECLRQEGLNTRALEEMWKEASILEEMSASDSLRARMQEYNMDTWSNIFGMGCMVRTNRGSRPGSPLADSQFSALMAKIGQYLQEQLNEIPEIQSACRHVDLPPATVIWADDLAIIYPIQDCGRILDITASMMNVTQRCFADKGLTVNYKKGKSEAVVTICGAGAKEERKKILVHPAVHLQGGNYQALRLEGKYRHLGTVQECGGGLRHEIIHRVASTWSHFRQIKHILARPTVDLPIRLRLAQSLLWSRLFYGAGAWGQLPKRDIQKLQTCYTWGSFVERLGRCKQRKQTTMAGRMKEFWQNSRSHVCAPC